MKRSTISVALSLIFVANAMAGETDAVNLDSQIASRTVQSKGGLIVAVTERGEVAANTAWLLSNQAQKNERYKPILLVLKPEDRIETLKALKLDASALPALIFLDSNGNELNRVVEAGPSTKLFQKKGIGATSYN